MVYSSVGGAERSSGIPHFESKRRVEQHLTRVIPAFFVRPAFFMENFSQALAGGDGELVLRFPLPGAVPLQLVAVRDVGVIAAAVLTDASVVEGDAIEIAGDELTGDEIAARIGSRLGRASRYEALPLEALGDQQDLRAMFRWFAESPAYQADIAATRAIDPSLYDLAAWLEHRS